MVKNVIPNPSLPVILTLKEVNGKDLLVSLRVNSVRWMSFRTDVRNLTPYNHGKIPRYARNDMGSDDIPSPCLG